ncbi:hypothetical protein LNV28_19460 [Paucibacter sp. DJ2R-2]|nr:hypothetical protein [Paucibacter sp. DJ2R-2]
MPALPLMLALFLARGMSLAQAAEPASPGNATEQAELRRLKQSQDRLESAYLVAVADCHRKFAVNDCIEQLRLQHQAQLRPLKQREDEIEAQLRSARAQAQRERVQQRQQEFAAEEAERRSQALLRPEASAAPPAAASAAVRKLGKASPGAGAQLKQQQAEQTAKRHASQRAEQERILQAHQRDVKQRQEQRKKALAPPLPVPSAAEIAALRAASAPASGAR